MPAKDRNVPTNGAARGTACSGSEPGFQVRPIRSVVWCVANALSIATSVITASNAV